MWDARRFATRHSCLPPEEWLAKNRLGTAHRASLRWAAPAADEPQGEEEPKGSPPPPPRSYSPGKQEGGTESGSCSSACSTLAYDFNHVQGGAGRRSCDLGTGAPRRRISPLLRRRETGWRRHGTSLFADCEEPSSPVNDDGFIFYECREVRGADEEWEKGWTSGGVIEAFHPDGVEEWGPAPPRYGGTLHCTDWAEVGSSGRPVAVLAGQSQISTPVLDGPGRPDGLPPRRREKTGQSTSEICHSACQPGKTES